MPSVKTLDALVVDDHEDLTEIFKEEFMDRGLTCHTVNTVEGASKLLAEHEYRLLICDYTIPDGGAEAVLSQVSSRTIKWLVTGAAHVDPEWIQKWQIHRLISKPFDWEEFFEMVESLLSGYRA